MFLPDSFRCITEKYSARASLKSLSPFPFPVSSYTRHEFVYLKIRQLGKLITYYGDHLTSWYFPVLSGAWGVLLLHFDYAVD